MMRRMDRDGVVLVEILVAIVILGSGGAAMAVRIGQELHRMELHSERERELLRAELVLASTSLLSRDELEIRLGRRSANGFDVLVSRPMSDAFRIAVASPGQPDIELLVTVVHRPEEE